MDSGLRMASGPGGQCHPEHQAACAKTVSLSIPGGCEAIPPSRDKPVELRQAQSAEPCPAVTRRPGEAAVRRPAGLVGPQPVRAGTDLGHDDISAALSPTEKIGVSKDDVDGDLLKPPVVAHVEMRLDVRCEQWPCPYGVLHVTSSS